MVKTPSFFERLTGGGDSQDNTSEQTPIDVEDQGKDQAQVETSSRTQENASASTKPDSENKPRDDTQDGQEEWMEEAQEGQLTIDVYQTDTDIVIKSTVAGVSPDDLDIAITNDMVTIRGRRDRDEEVPQDQYFYQECYWGPFSRSVILPADVASDKAEATMRHGILTIKLPKVEKEQTKKIKVRAVT